MQLFASCLHLFVDRPHLRTRHSKRQQKSHLDGDTTRIDTLTNTPSLLSAVSFPKSETISLNNASEPSTLLVETETKASYKLDFSADAFRLSEYVVDKDSAAYLRVPEPPALSQRGGSNAPTTYYSLTDSSIAAHGHDLSPKSYPSPSNQEVSKDDHETYIANLRQLQLGETDSEDFFTPGLCLSILHEDNQQDSASWERIDLLNYGWTA